MSFSRFSNGAHEEECSHQSQNERFDFPVKDAITTVLLVGHDDGAANSFVGFDSQHSFRPFENLKTHLF